MDYLLNAILVIITIAFCAYVLKAKTQAKKMSYQVRDSLKAQQEQELRSEQDKNEKAKIN